MENKHTIINKYTNMEQVYGKQGEQLLKSGGHSASLDETNKCRGQCGQPNNHQVVPNSCNKQLLLFCWPRAGPGVELARRPPLAKSVRT